MNEGNDMSSIRRLSTQRRKRTLLATGVALCALSVPVSALASAPSGSGRNDNKGDVWVDNVGQPAGPGHEMDPHLACQDINLWGNALADGSGTYTIDGWSPSGSHEQDYPATGAVHWAYTVKSGDQVLSVIRVKTLMANAKANGDAPVNKQGFHFKLQFSQDPQKHKTFWVNCGELPAPTPTMKPTPKPTPTPTPKPTAKPSASPTPHSTPTPSPGATPTSSSVVGGTLGIGSGTPSTGAGGLGALISAGVLLLSGLGLLLGGFVARRPKE